MYRIPRLVTSLLKFQLLRQWRDLRLFDLALRGLKGQSIGQNVGRGLSILAVALPSGAMAYPELTRHGAVSCTTCHLSPAGGGALTVYGRSMSREILSRWGAPNEESVLHGFLGRELDQKLDDLGLRLGGNVRGLQSHRENSRVRQGQFFLMQADLKLGVELEEWVAYMSAGEVENPRSSEPRRTLNSTEHWVMWRPSTESQQWGVRGGRFPLSFGGLQTDHTLSVRKLMSLGLSSARTSLEISGAGEDQAWQLGVSVPAGGIPREEEERALAARMDRTLSKRWRAGASFWRGELRDGSRVAGGFHGLGSWKDARLKPYLQIESLHLLRRRDQQADVVSHALLLRNGLEMTRGLFGILQIQHERGDVQLHASEVNRYGLGLQVFPRPHFEIYGLWHRVHRPFASLDNWSDEAFAVFHYYL